jgi:hypothetical protein
MRLVKALALTLLLAAGAALVWLGASTIWAAQRERRALAAWGPNGLEAAVAAIPKKETNAAAHDLEKAAHALGIDIRPRGGEAPVDEAPGMEKESKSEWGRTRAALTKWVTGEAERPEANVEPPPPAVAAFLAGHAGEIDAIEAALLSGPAPEWAQDASLLFAAPSPSLAGHLQLHTVLLGRALVRASAGDVAGADRVLVASWNLAAPERSRVDIPSRSIAFLATHLELGVLRKLATDPAPWRTRIGALEPRTWVTNGWTFEAWRVWKSGRRLQDAAPAEASGGWLASLAARPRERLASASLVNGWRAMSEAAARSAVSDGDVVALAEAFEKGAGRWAAPSMPAILAAAGGIRRADRLSLEAELTGKVFEIRGKREPSGAWPAAIPGIEASKAPKVAWTYTVTGEGRASIATNRLLTWPDRASSLMGWVSEPPPAKKAAAPKRR